MRHKKAGKQLSRNTGHRRALLRNIVTSLFKYEQIVTTDAKAKSLRPIAEKMITLAKRGDLHARRQALSYLQDKAVTHKLFDELKDRYMDKQGGYIRIVKKGVRKGDGAPISVVQLIPEGEEKKPVKQKPKKTKKVKAASPKPQEQPTEKAQEEKTPEPDENAGADVQTETADADTSQEDAPAGDEVSEESPSEDTKASEEEEKPT